MSASEVERQLERTRRRLSVFRSRVMHELEANPEVREVVEELAQTMEELSATLEQLSSTNEELGEAQLAAERHALRYQDLFRSAPDPYVVTDAHGVIRELNAAAENKFRRASRYLTGKPLLTLVAASDRDALIRCLSSLRQRRARLDDFPLRFGSPEFHASVSAVPESRGETFEIFWMLRDVTERVLAERALRAREAETRAVLDAALDGIFATDAEGAIRSVNTSLCRMFGYAADELPGRKADDLIAPTELGEPPLIAERAGQVREAIGVRRDGRPFPIQISVGRATGEGDVTFVASVRDLSGPKTLEAQLRAALAAATEAEDRERQTLAADLHDDVSQLLTLANLKLGGLRQTARMRAVKAGVREVEELVARAHQRIDSLTFQLAPPILRDVGLASAAEWLAEEIERSYGLRVKVERDGEPPLEEAMRTALFRALRELLINAARHAHTEEARVRLTREGGDLTVSVEDDGIGFDERSGGFGLVSVRERLEALGARFEIESSIGHGTRVRIVVPLTR